MQSYINNADLTPVYVPDDQVKIEGRYTPDWVKTLIMVQVHLETLMGGKTLDEDGERILNHFQEMGVNGLWVTPIGDRALTEGCNGYHNFGPHTIFPGLTGTTDYAAGWQCYKRFIDAAHARNIRIIQDVTSWGVNPVAPLIKEHPEFFDGQPNRDWGGIRYCWEKPDFKEWYIQQLVNMALVTGLDGFRWDVEPRYAGRAVQQEIRDRLVAKGRHICSMSELGNVDTDHLETYDFEQLGVIDNCAGNRHLDVPPYFIGYHNIVDSVKSGRNIGSPYPSGEQGCNRFYTYDLVDHDCWNKGIYKNRLVIGYQAIFAPFIPLWWQGEEWDSAKTLDYGRVNYFSSINWSMMDLPENRAFFEDVKKMIRIRRSYPEIFNYFPADHRDANILSITVEGNTGGLVSYARYAEKTAILVIASNRQDCDEAEFTVDVSNLNEKIGQPDCGLFHMRDLVSGEVLFTGEGYRCGRFSLAVKSQHMRILELTVSENPDEATSEI